LPGKETRGAPTFQNGVILSGFLDKNVVPAESIAVCGDLIATALQGGVMHQVWLVDEDHCNIALFFSAFRFSHYNEEAGGSSTAGASIQMSLSEPRVSIVILNWNSYQVTLDCLLSLRKMDYRNFEVVLVDNGSVDGSPARLLENVPEIRLIRNATNLGFAGGCNVGMRDALRRGTDYVLLLNNDTIVAPDFLTQLVRVAGSDEKIGAVSPKILFFDHPDRLNYAGGEHRRWRLFPKVFGLRHLDDGTYDKIREVSFLTGCAFLIKAEVVRDIGVLEEVYFHFYEDIEWSLRVLKAGYKTMYVPSAVIWHKEHYVTEKNQRNGFIEFQLARANMIFARKHVPLKLWPFKMPFFCAWMVYRTLVFSRPRDWQKVLSLYKGFWAGFLARLPEEKTKVDL
jgi:GT2 family glycosyltransferase